MHDSMSNEVPILKKQILLVEDETVFAVSYTHLTLPTKA